MTGSQRYSPVPSIVVNTKKLSNDDNVGSRVSELNESDFFITKENTGYVSTMIVSCTIMVIGQVDMHSCFCYKTNTSAFSYSSA